jgi:ABC-type sugar transport system substrate-binding protein
MGKKKILVLLLVVAMVLAVFTACTPKSTAKEEPTTEKSTTPETGKKDETPAKKIRILLSNAYYTAPYCAAYNPAAEAKAKELGVELVILDAAGNQQTALEHANQAIADGYDGFIYFPADVDGALPIIEAINDSGIPMLVSNSYDGDKIDEVGIKYFFGPDAKSHGISMAKFVKETFKDGANIVAIEGTAGHGQTIKINEAFAEAFDSKYVFLDRQDCNFQAELAMTKMTDMLTSYGLSSKGGKIDCIISHDGGMMTGIISALEAAGYKPGDVKIVACGSNKVVYDALQSGWLSATSTQDPSREGAQAVELTYNIITGAGTVQTGWIKLETPVATVENADEFNWF